jgi:hypothetical protein
MMSYRSILPRVGAALSCLIATIVIIIVARYRCADARRPEYKGGGMAWVEKPFRTVGIYICVCVIYSHTHSRMYMYNKHFHPELC